MNGRIIHFLLLVTVVANVTSAFGLNTWKQQNHAAAKSANATPKACALLTGAEIQAVQGESVEESKPSEQNNGGMPIAECLFRTTTPAKSVSVAVAIPGKQNPRDFWRKQFHPSGDTAKLANARTRQAKGQKKEEDDESTRPRKIPSVGDEAFWVGGPISGALYVLRGNKFIRVSVGGVRDESERIRKSVALAQSALKRI